MPPPNSIIQAISTTNPIPHSTQVRDAFAGLVMVVTIDWERSAATATATGSASPTAIGRN
jgi:hypothetical protein